MSLTPEQIASLLDANNDTKTRGSASAADAAAVRDSGVTFSNEVLSAVGDIDGDGKTDGADVYKFVEARISSIKLNPAMAAFLERSIASNGLDAQERAVLMTAIVGQSLREQGVGNAQQVQAGSNIEAQALVAAQNLERSRGL